MRKVSIFISVFLLILFFAGDAGATGDQIGRNVNRYGGLAEALSIVGATPTTLLITDTQVLTSGVTVQETVTLMFGRDGEISLASGVTLTINSSEHIIASHKQQIFSVSGSTVVFTNPGVAYVGWWYSGSGDAATAIQAAENSGAKIIKISGGTWPVSTTITVDGDIEIVGDGDESYIRVDADIYAFTTDTSDNNISFKYLRIGASSYTAGQKGGITAVGAVGGTLASCASYIEVESCRFDNMGKSTGAIRFWDARDSKIINNRFYYCNKDIEIGGQSINVIIDNNIGEGIGNGAICTGTFIDVYAVLTSDHSTRVTNFSTHNVHTYSNLIDNPEGIIITNNICVGYGDGIVADCILHPQITDNIIDTIYTDGVQLRGCHNASLVDNWIALNNAGSPSTSYGAWVEHTQKYMIENNYINYLIEGIHLATGQLGNIAANTIEFSGTTDSYAFYSDAGTTQIIATDNHIYSGVSNTFHVSANDERIILVRNKLITSGGSVSLGGIFVNHYNNSWNNVDASNPGMVSLVGGMRMMWGTTDLESGVTDGTTKTWVIDFTDIGLVDYHATPYNAQATPGVNAGAEVSVTALSATGLTVILKNNSGDAANFKVYWIVLGRDSN